MNRATLTPVVRTPATGLIILAFFLVAPATAQKIGTQEATGSSTVLGVCNMALKDGADALLAKDYEEGVRLTHIGLNQAFGKREEEAALSNLCAGYLQLKQYEEALKYCEILLARNDRHWRAYNNRALIYILTKQWEKADADLKMGESLRPNSYTIKVARAMYMDALYPVNPEVEVDDRDERSKKEDAASDY